MKQKTIGKHEFRALRLPKRFNGIESHISLDHFMFCANDIVGAAVTVSLILHILFYDTPLLTAFCFLRSFFAQQFNDCARK